MVNPGDLRDAGVDTVVVAFTDMQGRLMGKRYHLDFFLEEADAGYEAEFGSELEFFLFKQTYAEAHAQHYRELTPSVPYILDYHVLASTYDEPFLRQIRNGMAGAGLRVESSKGEAWPGQHEINFRYADALQMADDHVVYKNGAKEIA